MSEPDPRPSPRTPYSPDGEISLYELWWTLMRRKWVAIGIAALCITLGVIYALVHEPEYRYTTTLEIGRIVEHTTSDSSTTIIIGSPAAGGGTVEQRQEHRFETVPIAEPSSLRPLIADSLVPMVRSQLRQEAEHGGSLPGVDVDVADDDSNLLHLRSQGTTERAEPIKTMHERVVVELRGEHAEDIERAREALGRDLEEARAELEVDLGDIRARLDQSEREQSALEARIERLEARRERLDEQIADTEARLAQARSREERAERETGEQAGAMALWLIQSSIADMSNRLDNLKEQRFTELPEQESETRIRLGTLEAERASVQARLEQRQARFERLSADIEDTLDRIRPTQARAVAVQSTNPVGAGASLIIALSTVLGGMLGVFAAFFVEFVSSARRLAERKQE